MHHQARVALRQGSNDEIEDAGNSFRTADLDLAGRRIGQELDCFDGLLQVVERRHAALEQGLTIEGWLDAFCAPIEETHADGVLKIGDDLRDNGLGYAKFGGRFGHAASARDSHKHMQVTELQSPAELLVPIDSSDHRKCPMRVEESREFPLYR